MGVQAGIDAGWVWQRSDRAVREFWRYVGDDAAHCFGSPGSGGDPARRLEAILNAVRARDICYVVEPPIRLDGQVVRDATDVARSGEGTCLDLCAVVAGCCVHAGLRSWVVFASTPEAAFGHAFLVVDRRKPVKFPLANPLLSSWEELRALIGLEDLVVLDPAALCTGYSSDEVEVADVGHFVGPYQELDVCDIGAWAAGHTLAWPGVQSVDGLRKLWSELAPGTIAAGAHSDWSIARVVQADARVVEYRASPLYQRVKHRLLRWLGGRTGGDGSSAIRWLVVTGDGGTGKTRFAKELLTQLSESSQTGSGSATVGELRRNATDAELATIAGRPGFVGILVDYGEAMTSATVTAMLDALRDRPTGWGPVLIVVTARVQADWTRQLNEALGSPAEDLRLDTVGRIDATAGEDLHFGRDLWIDAVNAYGGGDMAPPDGLDLSSLSPLEILMAAALRCAGQGVTSIDAIYDEVLNHERRYWAHVLDRAGLLSLDRNGRPVDLSAAARRDLDLAVAMMSLFEPPVGLARPVLDALRHRDLADEVLDQLFTRGGHHRALRPDRVAERLIESLFAIPALEGGLVAALIAEPEVLPGFLANADRVWPEALPPWLERLASDVLRDRIDELSEAAVLRSGLARRVLQSAWDADVSRDQIHGRLDGRLGDAMPQLRAADLSERLSRLGPMTEAGTPAALLRQIADSQTAAGDLKGAAAAASQEVELWRRSVETDPALLSSCAGALNNLGIRLSEAGRRAEALAPTEEAVAIRRRLAATNPDAYEPDLAGTLTNLGVMLSEAGRRPEALTPTDEAVAIYRRLAAENSADLPELARSLRNLATYLVELDRIPGAHEVWRTSIRNLQADGLQGSAADLADDWADWEARQDSPDLVSLTEAFEVLAEASTSDPAQAVILSRGRRHAQALVLQQAPAPLRDRWIAPVGTAAAAVLLLVGAAPDQVVTTMLDNRHTSGDLRPALEHADFLWPMEPHLALARSVLDGRERLGVDQTRDELDSRRAAQAWVIDILHALQERDRTVLEHQLRDRPGLGVLVEPVDDSLAPAIELLGVRPIVDVQTLAAYLDHVLRAHPMSAARLLAGPNHSVVNAVEDDLADGDVAAARALAALRPSALPERDRDALAIAIALIRKPQVVPGGPVPMSSGLRHAFSSAATVHPELAPLTVEGGAADDLTDV